jgi:magnesium transporter
VTAALTLVEQYVATHPEAAARHVERAGSADQAGVLSALAPAHGATLLRHMAPAMAARALGALDPPAAADALAELALDVASSLVRRLEPLTVERLLDAMAADTGRAIRALLVHAPNTAGGVMDPLVLTVPAAATVGEARALVAREPRHLYYYVFVVDDLHRLAGVFDVAELMQADPDEPLSAIVKTHVVWIAAGATIDAVVVHPGWRDLDALPVLGEDRRFLGVLRHRRVRQLVERGQPTAGDDRAVRTVMALGEIYWLGLCGLLQGISATASEPASGKEGA